MAPRYNPSTGQYEEDNAAFAPNYGGGFSANYGVASAPAPVKSAPLAGLQGMQFSGSDLARGVNPGGGAYYQAPTTYTGSYNPSQTTTNTDAQGYTTTSKSTQSEPTRPGLAAGSNIGQSAYEQQAAAAQAAAVAQAQAEQNVKLAQQQAEAEYQRTAGERQAAQRAQEEAAARSLQELNYGTSPTVGTAVAGQQGRVSQKNYEAQQLAMIDGQNAAATKAKEQADALALLQKRYDLSEGAFKSRLGEFDSRSNQFSAPATVTHGTSLQGNEEQARALAFARAKNLSGNTTNAAIQALQGMFEDQGTTGSTMEAGRIGQQVGNAGAGVQDFIMQQYISDLQRQAAIADLEYSGRITQRGQDITGQSARQNALLQLMDMGPIY